jgi:aminomethyltransferase
MIEVGQTEYALVAAYGMQGEPALDALSLTADTDCRLADFDNGPHSGWLEVHGVQIGDTLATTKIGGDEKPVILKAKARVSAWFIRPVTPVDLVGASGRGTIVVSHQRASANGPTLPQPLGDIRDEFTVERGTARSYELRKGEVVQIIDVDGQQCSDFQACRLQGLDLGAELFIDGNATRSLLRRAFPLPGLLDKFFDADLVPLLQVMQDTCGRHDTFGLACHARGYQELGFPGHVNCSDNISDALASWNVKRRRAWPAINFFWNTWLDSTHNIQTEESYSRPGDYVAMAALDDLLCVSTACPDDIDPINGWNPTDIHVRISRPESKIQRAVAYRQKEDSPLLISEESAFHERLAPLTSQFAPARDLWAPITFPGIGTMGEYWACRNAVTLQDMSGLRKFDVVGPDAERLLQYALTRDIAKLSVWRGTYSLMCDKTGAVVDDGTLFRLGPKLFRWCCGSEESGRVLKALANENGWQVRINDMRNALPNLALQGPKSRELLNKIIFTQPHVPSLDQLKWFGVTVARLGDREGAPFMLSRSGYTGELGYEIFCTKSDALAIWDGLMAAGEEFGIKPMGSAALEIIRIEAGFAAADAEFAPGVDAHDAGLGFAVDLRKSDFVGKDALARNATSPRRQLKGLILGCDDVPAHGAQVFNGERPVGVITSATRSPTLETAISMARLAIEVAEDGTELEVGMMDGRMKRISARVVPVPFIDPKRERARA